MVTAQEAWGFGYIYAATPEGDEDTVPEFMRQCHDVAADMGISTHKPNDGLDASRDLILTDAAARMGMTWEVTGPYLLLTHKSLAGVVDWPSWLASQGVTLSHKEEEVP